MTTLAKANLVARERVEHLERRFGRKRLSIFGGAIGLIVVVFLLREFGGQKKEVPPPPPRVVETAKVIEKDVPLYLDEIGTCTAFESVQVQAQVSGQIMQRHFQDGADVKQGDLLFTIDQRPYQAALDQAKGALAQAQAQLAIDQLTLKRQQDLRARNVNAQQEVDVAQATVNTDNAKVQSGQAAVAAAQVNFDNCLIRSPIDGRTGIRNFDVGNLVGPGSSPLVQIQRLDPIYTDFTVAEPDIPLVRHYLNGPPLEVLTDAPDDTLPPRSGKLSFIDNALQPGSGTVKARATTDNPDRALWPSQFVRVRLILQTLKNAKLVPSSAVQVGQNGPYIFVVKPDSTLDLRQVKSGQHQDGDLIVVNDGVNVGETVVVSGQLQLAPGAKVVVKEAAPEGGAGQPLETKSNTIR